jgi:hypothetical protein
VNDRFRAARAFIYAEARLLEQRLFATLFEAAPASGVLAALSGFRNDDGGFGHGLEPDKRCPASLPIDVEVALTVLDMAGARDGRLLIGACDYLASVAGPDGGVALASPVIEDYPRAEHWSEWAYRPGLNPTAGLAGLLHKLDVEHPWLDRADAFCWAALDAGLPADAHALGETLTFLEHAPDRDRAEALAGEIGAHLTSVEMFRADPDAPGYGLTPLHYAPTPTSRWRALFSDAAINGHLDRFERDQEPDGGWAITWQPPSEAATLDYRGVVTLHALRLLVAYGRLEPA